MPTFEWVKYMEILATELNKKYLEEKKTSLPNYNK